MLSAREEKIALALAAAAIPPGEILAGGGEETVARLESWLASGGRRVLFDRTFPREVAASTHRKAPRAVARFELARATLVRACAFVADQNRAFR